MYDRVADLPVTVEGYELERHTRSTPAFERVTTTFALAGANETGANETGADETGRGEDVIYEESAHDALQDAPPDLPTGSFTLGEYSRALDDIDLFPAGPPDSEKNELYRRWAVESAVLDLALRQEGTTLGELLGRSDNPVNFVASPRIEGPKLERIQQLLEISPNLAFKLDPENDWTLDLVERLADLDRVRVLDLKGHYGDVEFAPDPDPDLYRLVAEEIPDAILEDPWLDEETRSVLDGHEERISWDVPITGVESVEELPFEPSWLNIKPSRFGTLQSLLETIDYCEKRGIRCYGGGQFELGVGRAGIQELASLFYPDAPNDVSPIGYNDPEPDEGLPSSPLSVSGSVGFGVE